MTRIAHIHRRGAMYIWRKRCPVASCLVGVTLCLSLQTREASTAAYRAAITTHQFYLMFASMTGKMITRAEAQSYSEAVLDAELARIEGERWSEADGLSLLGTLAALAKCARKIGSTQLAQTKRPDFAPNMEASW